jgi:alpha-L-arabinofuranosidase
LVDCQVTGVKDTLDVNATLSKDGQTLVLKAVNPSDKAVPAEIHLAGYAPEKQMARVAELSGPLDARNTAAQPKAIVPQERAWQHGLKDGKASYNFPPRSVTIIKWE